MPHPCLPDHQLEQLLAEDVPHGDLTSHTLALGQKQGWMRFLARHPMILCGSEEARRMGELRGLSPGPHCQASGSPLNPGDEILTLRGNAEALHSVWKVAQTLMEYLSGIASSAAAIVSAAREGHPRAVVACTRKTFPGTKAAAIKAIRAGGAIPHRLGLSETLLVFPEHLLFLDDSRPETLIQGLRQSCPERKSVVEVCSPAAALAWAQAGADVLQLEKFDPTGVAAIADSLRTLPHPPVLAVAGGITPGNAKAYAQAGATLLVTSAPYFAPPKDVAVVFGR